MSERAAQRTESTGRSAPSRFAHLALEGAIFQVSACQNCGLPFQVLVDCPADRDGIHIQGGVVTVLVLEECQDSGRSTSPADGRCESCDEHPPEFPFPDCKCFE